MRKRPPCWLVENFVMDEQTKSTPVPLQIHLVIRTRNACCWWDSIRAVRVLMSCQSNNLDRVEDLEIDALGKSRCGESCKWDEKCACLRQADTPSSKMVKITLSFNINVSISNGSCEHVHSQKLQIVLIHVAENCWYFLLEPTIYGLLIIAVK